ncbi:hypothetical protein DSCO28_73080 (plasmid) [Desulfosarcina ovata subsp. sediminis]|uniref:Uncharacterized protein n=1 Tax=Desulfosarcina ovata subsp. sediminis TaxID=885957 RepID=A0A5K8A2H7_9BACT|nr:hypothetical protein [Desulfosarcina ovata]BBO86742.1 hypothetical protein DSCO28_73080 [Desulfosarcina ovata subsp. sediminis]
MAKVNVGPKISIESADWLSEKFGTRNAGAAFAIEIFPSIFESTIGELRGRFEKAELGMILDVENNDLKEFLKGSPSPEIKNSVFQAFNLYPGVYEKRWKVDGKTLNKKLSSLSLFQEFCLKLWVCWYDESVGFDSYVVSMLLPGQDGFKALEPPKSKIL